MQIPRLPAPRPKSEQAKRGKSWVQVLRSAPTRLQRDEANAERTSAGGKQVNHAQNDCLKAMLTAIHGAQKFIYIEGQFFQSAYGSDQVDEPATKVSGPMAALIEVAALPGYELYGKWLGIHGLHPMDVPGAIRWSQVDDVRRHANGKGAAFLRDLDIVLKNIASIKASRLMGKAQEAIFNPIGEALASRIEHAIYDGLPFHVYLVLPVHPEGTLNTLNIMTQLHLTMQSLVFGSYSLINRIRRAVLVEQLCRAKGLKKSEAVSIVNAFDVKKVVDDGGDKWKKYLTLLNLRNWQVLDKRPVTEQIYVHSKLLIADDRVAILGSANINDRSQLGNRDSELAVIVRDDEQVSVKLDGVHEDLVSANIHRLRTRLWKKIFGLMGSARPANDLASIIEKPAAGGTWEAIQRVAYANAIAYQNAFPFLAKVQGKSSPIWPTWGSRTRSLNEHMPFNERFWRADEAMDEPLSWDAKSRKAETLPANVQGFIVALPVSWTMGENNLSGMNLTLLANNNVLNSRDGLLV
jgi:phospholipase D1/2